MRSIARISSLVAAAGALLAAPALAQTLTGAGATFPYPVYAKWFDAWHQKTGIAINYQPIGSGAGIQQVRAGTVDFGASDAALSDDALRDMPRKVIHFPTVAGAVVMAYNLPDVAAPLTLSGEVVTGIYLGKITQWNDRRIAALNPGVTLPASPILAVHRSDGSGTTNIFTTYLSSASTQWKELVGAGTSVSWPVGIGGKGNDGVAGLVRQTPGSVGYVELAYAMQNRLSFAAMRNRAGRIVHASIASTQAALSASAAKLARDVRAPIVDAAAPDAWPIAGLTFLLVYRDMPDPAKARALADFIGWEMHEGQADAQALLYAPLPDAVVKVNEANLRRLTARGRPLVAAR
ncbi:MAG TPA: phosphate ABC transporter substrate-binding protein PstS [Candidatus Eisenbacteria bacterium]|nr:phosphate ABC transporter substrate-binding protein PstS [Candidatus Eisenbacteria bacterium]